MLGVTSSSVLVERFYVFEFLGSTFRSDGWSLLFGYAAGDGGAGVRVDGRGAGSWGEDFDVGGRDETFFEAGFDF